MNKKQSIKADEAGIASAILCTIHCMVVPVVFLLKFSWTANNANYHMPSWWEKLDYIFLVISFLAVYHSAAHNPNRKIKVALWIFWGILALAIIFQAQLHMIAYIASVGLITTHLLNIKRIRKSKLVLKNFIPML